MRAFYELLCLLAACAFLILCMGLYTCMAAGHRLEAELKLPENTEKQQKTDGKLCISNHSWLPVFGLAGTLFWENRLTGEKGEQAFRAAVPGRSNIRISFQIETKYSGSCLFQVKEVQVRDAIFLFRRSVPLNAKRELIVLPDIRTLPAAIRKEEAYDCESFRYSAVKKGEDTGEVFQLRDYRVGDSMRQIHWKLSARLNELTVKEAGYPVFDSIMIFMETGFMDQMPKPEWLDDQASLTLSVMKSLVDSGVDVEFGYYDFRENRAGTFRIDSEEAFWQAALPTVRAGRSAEGVSGLNRFLESGVGQNYAHYIYITASEEAQEVEWLRKDSEVTVLDGRTAFQRT